MAYTFKSTVHVDSDVCPGVTFVLRKMTDGRRAELRLDMAPVLDRLTDLGAELRALDPEKNEKEFRAKGSELDEIKLHSIDEKKIRWATLRVDGLIIESEDGIESPGTLDNILRWPSELRAELLTLIDDSTVTLESEAKNFGPRTTFGAVVARMIKSSTVESAANQSTNTTQTDAAPAISQTE